MRVYNTLTRQKEEFVPIQPGKAGIYVCGPTVYNRIHLGNARPMVIFDTLRRFLAYSGLDVTFVTNFTDVDDKIIEAAIREGVDASLVSARYVGEAMKDAEGLNCLPASVYPRVTDEMKDIIGMIGEIIENGYAYEAEGTVFFDTSVKKDYGKLSGKVIEDQEAGSRVEVDERKRNPADFVLWKPAKPGGPSWASPWGQGRPGWHIECSCMIRKYLGKTIDIHAGGTDLVFPHHENETAQSEAANGAPLARYWMHNGMINVLEEKMSKSDGNFFLVRELSELFDYETIRFYLLSVHYRSPVSFSVDNMRSVHNGLQRLRKCAAALRETAGDSPEDADRGVTERLTAFKEAFIREMNDDLNTANAVAVLFDMAKYVSAFPEGSMTPGTAKAILYNMQELCGVLGLTLDTPEKGQRADEGEILAIIEERGKARAAKDWKRSDELRDALKAMGVTVKDTADGVKWSYDD